MKRSRMPDRTTPLRTETPLERGTRPLRSSGPTKARRAPMSPEEKLGRKLVSRRSEGWCEIRLPGCGNAATDWSHRIARGRGGLWDASNGLASCRSCHSLITDTNGHRAEYEDLGYIVATDADTTSVRVWLHGQRWVWLTDTGDYRNVPADCVKTWYRSEVLAERALSKIWRRPWRGVGVMPTRSYLCPDCRRWHLTSMSLSEYESKGESA